MKIIVLFVTVVAFNFGCGGHYTANLDTRDPGKSQYSGTAYGLLPPPGPREISRAKIDIAQAEILSAVADNIKNPARSQLALANEIVLNPDAPMALSNTRYGVVVNNARRPVWWQHPENPGKFKIEPDGFLPLPLSQMPQTIRVYQPRGDYRVYRPTGKTTSFAGLDTWFVVYIDRVY